MKSTNRRRQELALVRVERQVNSLEEARSVEVLEWCATRLSLGDTWEVLRRKLGLGPSHLDDRWKLIRRELMKLAVPENAEEALLRAYGEQQEMVDEVREFIKELDAKIDERPVSSDEKKTHYNFYKMKLDALTTLMEEKKDRFKEFVELRKLKLNRGNKFGIVINLKTNVPRPERLLEPKLIKKPENE